ncbi:MAG: 4Fe-4S dicluster domain-containing protein [Proteobacteria bacterium]|nr:4Fe-4S dicluster domain-containing protein [Pseudomonadota bacterium]
MFFLASLYVALAVFGFGLLYKVSTWFRYSLIAEDKNYPPGVRVSAALKGIVTTVFSPKILVLLKVLILDILLQVRTLQESYLRWLMHLCIYGGFMLLLLMHALESFISEPLFAEYYSTLNPFLFLRDLAGVMVITGIGLALYRRYISKLPRLKTSAMDRYAILILSVIMLSGMLLQGVKITSHTEFQAMEEDYAGLDDPTEVTALESYWVQHFGLVSPSVKGPFDQETLTMGREIHEMNCADCHSSLKWAFTGYATAKMISPIAVALDRANIGTVLWYIHFLACFIGLAYLPFSKMFHTIASPLSLLSNAVMDKEKSHPANLATKRILELDACTHCGTCSLRCAVGPVFEAISNPNILPSEKIVSLKSLASNKALSRLDFLVLQEGLCLCTNCHRCTDVCPVGINLQDLWAAVREDMLKKGIPELLMLSPLSLYRALMHDDAENGDYHKPIRLAQKTVTDEFNLDIQNNTLKAESRDEAFQRRLRISVQGNTFCDCYNCKACTMACPVVLNFDHPQSELGLVPHQVMHAAALGLKDLILGSKMLWACLGCYRCQEQCPQGVRVTDVFYELKNIAIKHVKGRIPKV